MNTAVMFDQPMLWDLSLRERPSSSQFYIQTYWPFLNYLFALGNLAHPHPVNPCGLYDHVLLSIRDIYYHLQD